MEWIRDGYNNYYHRQLYQYGIRYYTEWGAIITKEGMEMNN
jgi:hypothetical protein